MAREKYQGRDEGSVVHQKKNDSAQTSAAKTG